MSNVLIRVQNVEMFLEGSLQKDVRDEIQETLSYVIPNYKFLTRYKQDQQKASLGLLNREPWDGTITVAKRYYKGNGILRAPTGLLSYVREILTANKIPFQVVDERASLLKSPGYSAPHLFEILRDYQRDAVEMGLRRTRGVLKASTGCHRKNQGILMFDGTTKKIQDIQVGDKVMGPDSTPRVVLRLIRGYGQMYEIIPTKGKSFVVNDEHMLTLVRTNKRRYTSNRGKNLRKNGMITDISVNEYLDWSKSAKHIHKLFRVPIKFKNKKRLPLPPYLVGLFLSDGCLTGGYAGVCNEDNEVRNYLEEYGQKNGMKLSLYQYKDECPVWTLINKYRNGSKNEICESLKVLGLWKCNAGNKFIPEIYKTASLQDRLELLAGIIDGDGSYDNTFDYITKSKKLADDMAFVIRSVGLAAYPKPVIKTCTNNGKSGLYFRMTISGDLDSIPCKIPRKKASRRRQKKSVLRTGLKTKKLGYEEYYGFTLDKDGRYLLDDFTVTHNSGKTEIVIATVARASVFPAMFYVTSCDLLEQAYDRFQKYVYYNGEVAKIGRIGGGHCDIQPITIATVQSCQRALDGSFTKNKYDDYNADDRTKFTEQQKRAIRDVVHEAQFVYVDEAQHVSCETIQSILNASHKAKIRIGGSASPWRDDGLDILIEASFGRRYCDIDASFLIKNGYLIKPFITFNHFNQTLGPAEDWQAHYKTYVVQNDARNEWISQRALFHMERARPTIILVKWVEHAEILQHMIEGSEILTSSGKKKKSPKKRKEILDRMRSGELKCIIGTTLLDEGVDVPKASAGILAGGGKSSTRELQRVGRFIRKDPSDPDKKFAFIEEFHDHTRWLSYHAKMRRQILETEREFEIGDRRII